MDQDNNNLPGKNGFEYYDNKPLSIFFIVMLSLLLVLVFIVGPILLASFAYNNGLIGNKCTKNKNNDTTTVLANSKDVSNLILKEEDFDW